MRTRTLGTPRQNLVNFARTRMLRYCCSAELAINDVIADGGAAGTIQRAMYDYYLKATDEQASRLFKEVENGRT